jgi:hypothetical protein
MCLIQNIYTFFNSIFEILTFRTKPEFNEINSNNKYDEYEFIMLNEL